MINLILSKVDLIHLWYISVRELSEKFHCGPFGIEAGFHQISPGLGTEAENPQPWALGKRAARRLPIFGRPRSAGLP